MNLISVNKVLTFIGRLADPHHPTEAYLPANDGKAVFDTEIKEKPYFPRVLPEEAGVSSASLAAMLTELTEDRTLNMHTLTVLRGGRVILDAEFGAYDASVWNYTFSECKTVVSLAVGILCGRGLLSLDDKVSDLFSDRLNAVTRLRFANITVRELLTMRSGIVFNEVEAMVETDWIRAWLNSGVTNENVFDPKAPKPFVYNSMNTYLLSVIVSRKTGKSLSDFLAEALFGPMGITRYYWEKSPEGYEKGGWGLYILPEDMAKLGTLVMNHGVWEGKQLVPAGYVREAMTAQTDTPPETGNKDVHYRYGYQMWVGDNPRSFLFNGMLGQNVLGFPDTGVVIVSTAGNGEMFQQSHFYEIMNRYLGTLRGEAPLPQDPEGEKALAFARLAAREHTEEEERELSGKYEPAPVSVPEEISEESQKTDEKRSFFEILRDLFKKKKETVQKPFPEPLPEPEPAPVQPTLPEEARRLAGRSFRTKYEDAASLGLLPVILQIMQCNYTKGLEGISFSVKTNSAGREIFYVTYDEREAVYILPVGFEKSRRATLYFRGEAFLCAVRGQFAHDEDDNTVLKLRVDFLETPCSRTVKMFFRPDGTMLLRQGEEPGMDFIYENVLVQKKEIATQPVIGAAVEKVDNDFLEFKVKGLMAPETVLTGIR